MKVVLIALIGLILMSCGYNVQTSPTRHYPAKSELEEVFVLGPNDNIPNEYIDQVERIGEIRIGDTGITLNQGLEYVVNLAIKECRRIGGDFIKITELRTPDLLSDTYRIRASVYRFNSDTFNFSVLNTHENETSLREHWTSNPPDQYEGIFVQVASDNINVRYRLGLVKKLNEYKLIYLSGDNTNKWTAGEVKATLERSATPGVFVGTWFMHNKTSVHITMLFDNENTFSVYFPSEQPSIYTRTYPITNIAQSGSKSVKTGTGFLISPKGYIATNYHVVDGARTIKIMSSQQLNRDLYARIVVYDKVNDLCILKLDNAANMPSWDVRYGFDDLLTRTGESVFCLGYPLTPIMGRDVKATEGIISSTTGFQGDVTSYQFSAAVQPGNSGGPLFSRSGNVIGIVNAKIPQAENVSYAIKMSYLKNLIALIDDNIVLTKVDMRSRTLSELISMFRDSVFIIETEN